MAIRLLGPPCAVPSFRQRLIGRYFSASPVFSDRGALGVRDAGHIGQAALTPSRPLRAPFGGSTTPRPTPRRWSPKGDSTPPTAMQKLGERHDTPSEFRVTARRGGSAHQRPRCPVPILGQGVLHVLAEVLGAHGDAELLGADLGFTGHPGEGGGGRPRIQCGRKGPTGPVPLLGQGIHVLTRCTPTARQKSNDAHETPEKPFCTSFGLTVAMTDQPVPSHSSASVK